MHSLMHESDILVCKPGGLTTTEALVVGIPMILMDAVPGQEDYNTISLVESGAAIFSPDPEDIVHNIKLLLNNPKRFGRMKNAGMQISNPNAAKDIAQLISVLRN